MSKIVAVGVANAADKSGFGMYSNVGKYATIYNGIVKMHHEIYHAKRLPKDPLAKYENDISSEESEEELSDEEERKKKERKDLNKKLVEGVKKEIYERSLKKYENKKAQRDRRGEPFKRMVSREQLEKILRPAQGHPPVGSYNPLNNGSRTRVLVCYEKDSLSRTKLPKTNHNMTELNPEKINKRIPGFNLGSIKGREIYSEYSFDESRNRRMTSQGDKKSERSSKANLDQENIAKSYGRRMSTRSIQTNAQQQSRKDLGVYQAASLLKPNRAHSFDSYEDRKKGGAIYRVPSTIAEYSPNINIVKKRGQQARAFQMMTSRKQLQSEPVSKNSTFLDPRAFEVTKSQKSKKTFDLSRKLGRVEDIKTPGLKLYSQIFGFRTKSIQEDTKNAEERFLEWKESINQSLWGNRDQKKKKELPTIYTRLPRSLKNNRRHVFQKS